MAKEPEGTGKLTAALVGVAALALTVGLVVFVTAEPKPSPDTMLALITSVVGVLGTHIGHVVGHRLGKANFVIPSKSERRET